MKKIFSFLLLGLLLSVGNAWGAEYTYDFSKVQDANSNGVWFSDNSLQTIADIVGSTKGKTETTTYYYQDGTPFIFYASTKYYFHADGYFLYGKSGSYIQLPTFSGEKITQVKAQASSGHSTNVTVNILTNSGNTASTSQKWGTKGQLHTYNISSNYQSSILRLQVTNAYNTQITSLTIVTEPTSSTTPTITPSVESLNFGTSFNNGVSATESITIECANLSSVPTVSISGTNASAFSYDATALTQTGGGLDITYLNNDGVGAKSATLTLTSGTATKSISLTATTSSVTHSGTQLDPLTVADVIALGSLGSVNKYWVKGIIGGSIVSGNPPTYIGTTEGAHVVSNLFLLEEIEDTVPVQLVNNSEPRTNLNLVDNINKLGAEVLIHGTIESYFSKSGVKNVDDYEVIQTAHPTIGSTGYATYYNSLFAYTMPAGCVGSLFTVAGGLFDIYEAGDPVPAGEALVIRGTAGEKTLVFIENNDTPFSGTDDNDLKGTDVAATTTGGDVYYGLSLNSASAANSVGFYWMEENGAAFNNGAHKAYLALSNSQAPARYYLFNEESNATDIQNVEGAEKAVKFMENGQLYILRDGVVYDAMGKTVR